jgi:histidine triad (HIT) family protein
MKAEGINFMLADGEAAGQEVFHVHLHVLPRFAGDGFEYRFSDSYGKQPARKQLDSNASAIKLAMGTA